MPEEVTGSSRLLHWTRLLQTIAQNGLAYSHNPFDIERFEQIRKIAAEMANDITDEPLEKLENLFIAEKGYATPKIDVRGAAFRDEKILLVREVMDNGRWTLPGGWADVTDAPSDAVEREMREESGYQAKAVKLAAVYDRDRHGHGTFYFTIWKFFFLCEINGDETGASFTPGIETSEVGFFAENDLPELSIGRVTPEEIHMLFEHHRRPEIPTEYD